MKKLSSESAGGTSAGPDRENRASFLAIEQLAVLKKFQNDLYRLTGLPFDFLDLHLRHSSRLHARRFFTPFCRMVNDTPLGCRACENDEKTAVTDLVKKKRVLLRRCHLGLVDVYVPIVIGGKIAGLFCVGQFFTRRPKEKDFRRVIGKLSACGINLEKARRAYFSAPVIDKRRAEAVIDLTEMVVGLVDAGRLQALKSVLAHDSIRKALDRIETGYAEPLTLAAVARASGLSASRLAHVLKAQTGMSFTEHLNMARVNWAKYYLANSRMRVSEAAFKVGFGNLSHFNHVFLRLTGLSPTRYLRQQSGTSK